MKKTLKKTCCILLCIALLSAFFACFASAEDAEAAKYIANAPVFRISCTVNGDAATQRGFCWYTKENCETKIALYEGQTDVTDSLTLSDVRTAEWEGYYMHKVTVSTLKPGTQYSYRLGGADGLYEGGVFTTDNGDDKVEFLGIADVQASNISAFQKGQRAAEKAQEMFPESDFMVNLGDLTNDSDNDEWNCYAATFDGVNSAQTFAPVAGNHDGLGVWHWFDNMFNLDTSESVQTLNGVNYSFDYGNAHFAVVNTNDLLSVSLSQLKWLRNDLNSTDKDWKIVFMHKSPYTLGKDGKWPDALYLTESLTRVLDACDVDLVMSGHDHQYLRTKSLKGGKVVGDGEGVTYVLAGTAGGKRYEIREFMLNHFISEKQLAAMTVQKDGKNDAGEYHQRYLTEDGTWEYDPNRIGSVFNSISIDGGTLTFKSYVLKDQAEGETEDVVTLIDSFELTKETGKNKATFTGSNSIGMAEYVAGVLPSITSLVVFTFGNWLPRFLIMLPKLVYVFVKKDIF